MAKPVEILWVAVVAGATGGPQREFPLGARCDVLVGSVSRAGVLASRALSERAVTVPRS